MDELDLDAECDFISSEYYRQQNEITRQQEQNYVH
jgi:hypothetical protein